MSRRTGLAAVAAAAALTVSAAGAEPLEFHRVHVPAGRLGDVPLGAERHVPMTLADFESAVTRARAATGADVEPTARATMTRWRATIDESGTLVGTVSCVVGAEAAAPGRVLPLGGLRVRRAVVIDGTPREAVVCGAGMGLALAIPEPGTYEFEFARAAEAPGLAAFQLPLPPALASSLELDLPPGIRPVLTGPTARHAVVTPLAGGAWRIDVGPVTELGIALEPRDLPTSRVAVWTDLKLSGPRADVVAMVVPAAPWRGGRLVLEQDPTLRVTGVSSGADMLDHETTVDGRGLSITLPRWLDGTRAPLVVHGSAPATGPIWRLPLLAAGAGAWVGGGSVVRIDPAFVVRDAELADCRTVAPDVAAAWPLPEPPQPSVAEAAPPAAWHVEHQGPGATLGIELGPRSPSFDVARVTTVDITPGSVRGRAACDVRVIGGVAFEITARVAPGWIIDSVDAVDWSEVVDAESGGSEAPGSGNADRAVDWRVVSSPVGDTLRIGLPGWAAGRRGFGLRISGHRAGLAPGAAFTTADIDMVRFEGEAAEAAIVDLRTGPDAFVEIEGRPVGWFEIDGRLAPLAEEGAPRGRIRGGDRAADMEARVVRRRPPLDVGAEIRLEARGDALVETFTFACQAAVGVESLVVDFAEPGGAGLAWKVESPEGVTATARRLDPAEGGLASRGDAVADSWLVELSVAVAGPVRIRAVRSVPFTAATPVPLAWVEGATEPGGRVVVEAPAGTRPRVLNRRLRELPTDPAASDVPGEFAYAEPAPGAAAELVPVAAGDDARAWAWRETVRCWCDESGAAESESRFDVENEGREAVSLSLAPGRRLESVLVDGIRPPGVEFGPAGAAWRIPLPRGQRRVEIAVRTIAAGRRGRGAWRVDPLGCSLDLPVLDQDVRLLLPPGLVLATSTAETDGSAQPPWTVRLFGVGGGPAPSAPTGFHSTALAAVRDRGAGVLVVRRKLLDGAAILAAVFFGTATFVRVRRRPDTGWLLAAVPAVAALWLPAAFVPVARAAWWGASAALAWSIGQRVTRRPWPRWGAVRATVMTGCLMAAAVPSALADGTGARVFITDGEGGGTALVPEPLFRAIAPFVATDAAAIRVCGCTIAAGRADERAAWTVTLEIDADTGGALVLDAGPGARWQVSRTAAAVQVAAAGREARLTATAAGRHTVHLDLAPAVVRQGAVETETAWIPVAPTAVLEMATAADAAGAITCECATVGGPFVAAPVARSDVGGTVHDVSAANRVRLVRPVDPRDRLAAGPRDAETVNELTWDERGCRVGAMLDVDCGPDLLRSLVVRADPRLDDLTVVDTVEPTPRLVSLGAGRVLVELPEAARGRLRLRLTARLPLADPVGVVDVPGIWLEGLPAEKRTVRFAATDQLDATMDPPPVAGATAAEWSSRQPARVILRRRRPQVRATQSLQVSFAAGGIDLALEAQIDAAAAALVRIPIDVPVGCAVDRVVLRADDVADPAAREAVDVAWTRTAADRVLLVVQRPRPGRFRLEVAARLARRPAARAPLPVIRARLGTATPLVVSWTAASPLVVTVAGSAAAGGTDVVEIPEGAADPEYTLAPAAGSEPAGPASPASAPVDAASRVEWAEVSAAFDARGRVHGLARFDIVGAPPVARLRLPPGMRLFDVLVDGRVVPAEPREADVWDVPLGDAPWPRTILAVFDVLVDGRTVADGRPLSLSAPVVEGLPGPEVLWLLRPPPGLVLRVAPPARPLDPAAFATARDTAGERIAAACDRAAAAASGQERVRLEMLAALRRATRGPEAEESWRRASRWAEPEPRAGDLAVVAAEPIVMRAVPVADATLPQRATATVVVVALAGCAWTVAARGRARR